MWMIIWLLPSGASLGLAGLPLPTSLLDQLVQLPQRVRLEPVGALALAQFPGLPRRAFQQRRAAGGRPGVVLVLRDELRHDVIAHVLPGVPARQVRAARGDRGDLVDSERLGVDGHAVEVGLHPACLLYTSDAADDLL